MAFFRVPQSAAVVVIVALVRRAWTRRPPLPLHDPHCWANAAPSASSTLRAAFASQFRIFHEHCTLHNPDSGFSGGTTGGISTIQIHDRYFWRRIRTIPLAEGRLGTAFVCISRGSEVGPAVTGYGLCVLAMALSSEHLRLSTAGECQTIVNCLHFNRLGTPLARGLTLVAAAVINMVESIHEILTHSTDYRLHLLGRAR